MIDYFTTDGHLNLRIVKDFHILRTQTSYVNKYHISRLFRYEDGFGPLISAINEDLGIDIDTKVPPKNTTIFKAFGVDDLSEETKAKVRQVYAKDFELWESIS